MSDDNVRAISDIALDKKNLYKEDSYTDLAAGSIQCLSPVKADGSPDPARDAIFTGTAQLMTPNGPVPIRCEISAKTLEEAVDGFPKAINKAVDRMLEQVRELQREEASRIVIPGGIPDTGRLKLK